MKYKSMMAVHLLAVPPFLLSVNSWALSFVGVPREG
jgi:hypothetical protein